MLTHHSAFDPETVTLLTEVLDRAADAIPRAQRSNECKSRLASNILGAAAAGERSNPAVCSCTRSGSLKMNSLDRKLRAAECEKLAKEHLIRECKPR